jgi:hypothetical protein
MNGFDCLGGVVNFSTETSGFVNWPDVFWDDPPITPINGDYAASSTLGNKKKRKQKME